MDAAKIHLRQIGWFRESGGGLLVAGYFHHVFPFIQTTQNRKIHSTTGERK